MAETISPSELLQLKCDARAVQDYPEGGLISPEQVIRLVDAYQAQVPTAEQRVVSVGKLERMRFDIGKIGECSSPAVRDALALLQSELTALIEKKDPVMQ